MYSTTSVVTNKKGEEEERNRKTKTHVKTPCEIKKERKTGDSLKERKIEKDRRFISHKLILLSNEPGKDGELELERLSYSSAKKK